MDSDTIKAGEEHLAQSGVKGMRWGVRRETDKQWKKDSTDPRVVKAITHDAVTNTKPRISAINNSSTYKGKSLHADEKLRKAYDKDVADAFNAELKVSSVKYTLHPTKNRAIVYSVDRKSGKLTGKKALVVNVAHAESDENDPEFDLVFDSEGFVVDIKAAKETIVRHGEEYLEHVGVKGMRWGVRRSREERKAAKVDRAHQAKQAHADRKKAEHLGKKKVKDLSNDELRFLNERLQLESKFKQLNPTGRLSAEKKIAAALVTVGLAQKTYSVVTSPEGQKAVFSGISRMNSNTGRNVLSKLVVKTATSPMKL